MRVAVRTRCPKPSVHVCYFGATKPLKELDLSHNAQINVLRRREDVDRTKMQTSSSDGLRDLTSGIDREQVSSYPRK